MGLLTFGIHVTPDGCVDHHEGLADDETHAFFTRLLNESGAMLWGRVTYERMEGHWPAVAGGDQEAPPALREWAVQPEAEPKYLVSSTLYVGRRIWLRPTAQQRKALAKAAGCARWAWNRALRRKIETYEATGKSPSAKREHVRVDA